MPRQLLKNNCIAKYIKKAKTQLDDLMEVNLLNFELGLCMSIMRSIVFESNFVGIVPWLQAKPYNKRNYLTYEFFTSMCFLFFFQESNPVR